jgi:hypothetical protein
MSQHSVSTVEPVTVASVAAIGSAGGISRVELTAWRAPVRIFCTGVGPQDLSSACATLRRLEELWDTERPDSDLRRLAACPATVVEVAPETVALATVAVRMARSGMGSDPAGWLQDVVLDERRSLVGLPRPDLLDLAALVPDVVARVLVQQLTEAGATAVRVEIGAAVRSEGGPIRLETPRRAA